MRQKKDCHHCNILLVTVTSPLHESRLHWIHDTHPNQPSRVMPRQAVPRNHNNTVPRNTNTVQNSDARAHEPLETIPSASWYNSNLPIPSASSPRKNVCKPVPRSNIQRNDETIQVRNEASSSSLPLRKRGIENIEERGVREREKIEVSLLFMMRAGPISAH